MRPSAGTYWYTAVSQDAVVAVMGESHAQRPPPPLFKPENFGISGKAIVAWHIDSQSGLAQVLVMKKDDITRQRAFELPPKMVFHVGNAHETTDGQVVLSYVGAPDALFLDQAAVALMAARPLKAGSVQLRAVTLDMKTGRARQLASAGEVELPRLDPRRIGAPVRRCAACPWLHFDARRQSTVLNLLDAAHVEDGSGGAGGAA